MSILKRIFGKGKKKEKKTECWYNNYPEQEKGETAISIDTGALSGENSYLYSTAQQAAKK